MSPGEVTVLIRRLKGGDRQAAGPLWDGYVRRLLGLARRRLGGLPRRAADSEDVALSAFKSFCRRAEQDGFAKLEDADDLWQILALLTTRKAADVVARELAAKRGGGQVRGESAFGKPGDESGAGAGIEQVPGRELSPAEVAELVEEYRALLDELGEESLRATAVWKLEGYTDQQIADKLGCSLSTVERKLKLIRATWSRRDGRANFS
jgi:DNA-directed RNA polymerase specialized sigma24 family protein